MRAANNRPLCAGAIRLAEGETMKIDRSYISSQNTYPYNNPQCIVVHNTDNFEPTANARAHARAQHDGNFRACQLITTQMTVTSPIRPHRTTSDAGTLVSITEMAICSAATAIETASAWKCVCRADITMRRLFRTPWSL